MRWSSIGTRESRVLGAGASAIFASRCSESLARESAIDPCIVNPGVSTSWSRGTVFSLVLSDTFPLACGEDEKSVAVVVAGVLDWEDEDVTEGSQFTLMGVVPITSRSVPGPESLVPAPN